MNTNSMIRAKTTLWPKRLLKIFAILAALGLLAFVITVLLIFIFSRFNPNNQFSKEAIMEILSKETVVYYSDGKTVMGSFFEDIHRDYVPFDSIPKTMIQAVISAEDKNFFKHGGVDYRAILYAIADDIRSFSFKRGGSSLTQQTAKNLFPNRSRNKFQRLLAKFPELVNAFRLEKFFSKEEILEFYLNQFYVSGNGHGVAIAARYFFGKELSQLGLVELAFIAGSVKGPNQYNPFISRSVEQKELKYKRAKSRVKYVLDKMWENKYINDEQYKKAVKDSIPFSKGSFRFKLSTNIVKVRQFIERENIMEILEDYGVEDYASEGLKIYTTLDPNLQVASEYATNKNLSQLSIILEGYNPPKNEYMNIVPEILPGRFYVAKICSTQLDKGKYPKIQVQMGSSKAWLSQNSLKEFFTLLNWHENGNRSPMKEAEWKKFFHSHLQKGNLILCSSPMLFPLDKIYEGELEFENTPKLQGGSRILKGGKILANVGGFRNVGYDRVNQAVRQFGSTFKPMVYAAACAVGWTPMDTLHNYRQLFRLGNTFYFPRPDHEPEDLVSMAWAGRRSENIASVYLLYNLLAKLNFNEFWKIAKTYGIHPDVFEGSGQFTEFVRDSLGFLLYEPRKNDIRFEKAKEEFAIDLVFDGRDEEAAYLKNLPYGWGYSKEAESLKGSSKEENILRREILQECFLNYLEFAKERNYKALYIHPASHKLSYFTKKPPVHWSLADPEAKNELDENLYINEKISIKSIFELEKKIPNVDLGSNSYAPENLFYSREFKALVSLKYMVEFAKKLGITHKMDPVLSFPLGSNVISLSEATEVYQTMKDGVRYVSDKTGESQLLVEKITLPNGKVIYEDIMEAEEVLDSKTKWGVQSILRNIVEGGTGRKVKEEVKVKVNVGGSDLNLSIPSYGKTGTTNDHRNGAFLGFISGPLGKNRGLSVKDGFAIGVYVGYDDNKKMEHNGFRGFGGTVSLDAWIQMANAITQAFDYAGSVDKFDLGLQVDPHWPLEDEDLHSTIKVKQINGLPLSQTSDSSSAASYFYLREP